MEENPEKIHQSITILHLRQLVLFLIILVLVILLENGVGLVGRLEGMSNFVFLKEEVLLAVFCLLIFAVVSYLLQLQWHNTFFRIYDDEVVLYSGIFVKKENAFSLKDVDSLELEQGVVGKLFNYGSISVIKSKILANEYLSNIPNTEHYHQLLSEKLEKIRSN